MKKLCLFSIISILVVSINSCKKDNSGNATLTVKLKDLTANYQEVNVEVIEIQIHSNVNGWESLNINDSIFDLLLLQNNANAVLGSLLIPAGTVSQVRLILGTQNTVKISNVSYPLEMTSEDESGLKLNIHQDLLANQSYTLMIDFDAGQSVKDMGNDTYKLKPVLNASFN